MTIRWGILGAGDVAEVKSGPAFHKASNSELVAVMRRDAEKAQDFAIRHKVPHWYTDVDELLNQEAINAIYVASPPLFHEVHAIKALLAGKNVYLEKPMALNTKAAKKIIEVTRETGGKLAIAHYRRQLPAFMKVRSLIEENAIGDIRFAEIRVLQPLRGDIIANTDENWRVNPDISGGGLFHDIGPHQIDLMLQYFGNPVNYSGYSMNQAGKYRADDAVMGSIRFETGVMFQGSWIFSFEGQAEQREECCLYGSTGSIRFSFFGSQVKLIQAGNEQVFHFENPENIQLPMIQRTVDYFLGKGENPCTPEEALSSLEIMEAFTG